MKARFIQVIERRANTTHAGRCYILCFKDKDGKSFRSWTDSTLGNYKRWYNAILALTECQRAGDELWMDGLVVKSKNLIDADSLFTYERVRQLQQPFVPDHEGVTKNEIERKDTM